MLPTELLVDFMEGRVERREDENERKRVILPTCFYLTQAVTGFHKRDALSPSSSSSFPPPPPSLPPPSSASKERRKERRKERKEGRRKEKERKGDSFSRAVILIREYMRLPMVLLIFLFPLVARLSANEPYSPSKGRGEGPLATPRSHARAPCKFQERFKGED
ncbi:hypothetical protein HZH68_010286 [Vespula germanica]|uniref:Uncharacterized protein n=1 Tax=Vespula germanica TaxID=30212 RepID=A0A834N208_VESGE|nr:hypothetical protein HZH68_010286 [Vespula germanica]